MWGYYAMFLATLLLIINLYDCYFQVAILSDTKRDTWVCLCVDCFYLCLDSVVWSFDHPEAFVYYQKVWHRLQ